MSRSLTLLVGILSFNHLLIIANAQGTSAGTGINYPTGNGTGIYSFPTGTGSGSKPTSTSASCPVANGDTYTDADGDKYQILCSHDFARGDDLEVTQQASLADCVERCSDYNSRKPAEKCVGVAYQATNGGNCYLKPTTTGGVDSTYTDSGILISNASHPVAPARAFCPYDNGQTYKAKYNNDKYTLACQENFTPGQDLDITTQPDLATCLDHCSFYNENHFGVSSCLGANYYEYIHTCYLKHFTSPTFFDGAINSGFLILPGNNTSNTTTSSSSVGSSSAPSNSLNSTTKTSARSSPSLSIFPTISLNLTTSKTLPSSSFSKSLNISTSTSKSASIPSPSFTGAPQSGGQTSTASNSTKSHLSTGVTSKTTASKPFSTGVSTNSSSSSFFITGVTHHNTTSSKSSSRFLTGVTAYSNTTTSHTASIPSPSFTGLPGSGGQTTTSSKSSSRFLTGVTAYSHTNTSHTASIPSPSFTGLPGSGGETTTTSSSIYDPGTHTTPAATLTTGTVTSTGLAPTSTPSFQTIICIIYYTIIIEECGCMSKHTSNQFQNNEINYYEVDEITYVAKLCPTSSPVQVFHQNDTYAECPCHECPAEIYHLPGGPQSIKGGNAEYPAPVCVYCEHMESVPTAPLTYTPPATTTITVECSTCYQQTAKITAPVPAAPSIAALAAKAGVPAARKAASSALNAPPPSSTVVNVPCHTCPGGSSATTIPVVCPPTSSSVPANSSTPEAFTGTSNSRQALGLGAICLTVLIGLVTVNVFA